jgi:acyl carrier protein
MPPDSVRRLRPGEKTALSTRVDIDEGLDEHGQVPIARGPVVASDTPRTTAPPALGPDALTGAVLALIAEVSGGHRTVTAEDDLFEMEFDSLMMAKLAARISRQLGAEVPLRAYFDAENVGDLIATVQAAAPA